MRIITSVILSFFISLTLFQTSFADEINRSKEGTVLEDNVKNLLKQEKYEDALKEFRISRGEESFREGIKFFRKKDYRSAISSWNTALAAYRENGRKEIEVIVLGNIGNAYDELGDYEKAIENYYSAIKIAEEIKDEEMQSDMLTNAGVSLWKKGDYSKSAESFEKAAVIEKKSGRTENEAFNLFNLGKSYRELKDYNKAVEAYNNALSVYAKDGSLESRIEVLTDLAYLYKGMGRKEEAAGRFLELIKLKDQAGDESGMEDILKAVVELKKQNEDTKQENEKAEKAEESKAEIKPISEAKISEEVIRKEKKVETAVEQPAPVEASYAEEEKEEPEKPDKDAGKTDGQLAELSAPLIQEGISLERGGKLDESAVVYRKALDILEKSSGESLQSGIMIKLGNILALEGNTEAEEMLNNALRIKRNEGDAFGEAGALQALGRYYLSKKSLPESLEYLMQSEAVYRENSDDAGSAYVMLDIGDCYYASGKYGEAGRNYQNSFDIGVETENRDLIWKAKYGLARCMLTKKDFEPALESMLESLELAEKSRGNIVDIRLPDRKRNLILSDVVELMTRLYEVKGGKYFAEAAYLYSEIQSCIESAGTQKNSYEAIAGEDFRNLSVYSVRRDVLKNADEVLLKYIFVGDAGFVFIISKDGFSLQRLTSSKTKIDNLVRDIREPINKVANLSTGDWINKVLREFDIEKAEELYNILIAPVEKDIIDKKVLLIEPTGSLSDLPFELLVKKSGTMIRDERVIFSEYSDSVYLLDGFSVIYSPLSVFLAEKAQTGQFENDFCMYGEEKNYEFSDIEDIFRGVDKTQLVEEPSFDDIEKGLSGCMIVQFQMPVRINTGQGQESGLIINGGRSEELISGRKISGIESKSLLAVFTNSQTSGISSVNSDYSDFVFSNLMSGIRSVIYPLWNVNKYSSLEIFKEFYNLYKEMDYQIGNGEALRLAKKKIRDSNFSTLDGPHSVSLSHPYFWSNLVQEGR